MNNCTDRQLASSKTDYDYLIAVKYGNGIHVEQNECALCWYVYDIHIHTLLIEHPSLIHYAQLSN